MTFRFLNLSMMITPERFVVIGTPQMGKVTNGGREKSLKVWIVAWMVWRSIA